MFDKLKDIQQKFVDVEKSLSDLAQISNPQRLQELSKLHAELSPIVSAYKDFQHLETAIEETETLLTDENDADMLALAQEELDDLKRQKDELTESLKMLLIPKDLNDEKNVIIEIRAGTGGEEASLFAAEIFRMYTRYAERKSWKVEMLNANATGLKGFKEVIFSINGKSAYSLFKYEVGFTASNEFRRPKQADEFTHLLLRSQYFPKQKNLTLK